ncbi:unnamed protein product [Kuraishia capsulata CBS 1993]|uniref:Uncharacterized protein n=1 Tax=Kuraishia capsulata CBS 1993 TaxID=1382522 RepID=W6ML98_9ASCO|nr:uncharacterized protein KUCA_T00002852001 [Kuraishia capsulata CBS 1993]CDK26878.1 unnamed protein product [Kuraishia capsulata CBS 1993]
MTDYAKPWNGADTSAMSVDAKPEPVSPTVEITYNGIVVPIRVEDRTVDGFQLLRAAGLDDSAAVKALGDSRDRWISEDTANRLAAQYSASDLVEALFGKSSAKDEEKQASFYTSTFGNGASVIKRFTSSFNNGLARSYSTLTENDDAGTDKGDGESPAKKARTDQLNVPVYEHDGTLPSGSVALKPLTEADVSDLERSKDVMTMIFLPGKSADSLLELVGGDETVLNGIQVDAPIDDLGHTALHWAATLGKVSLVRDLVKNGANRLRGNNDGQTALVRAVMVTNGSETCNFAELLDYLYPALTIVDNQGRTVLHHIAVTSGMKGRSSASKYYLESLLEWIVKRGSSLPSGHAIGLGRFMSEVVNVRDKNGDTCLNISARAGNKAIAQQLLDIGADPSLPNKVGLMPVDFGINIGPVSSTRASVSSSGPPVKADTQNSEKIISSMQEMLVRLNEDFKSEIATKSRSVKEVHSKLRSSTLRLSSARRQLEELQEAEKRLIELKSKITNVERAIDDEEAKFAEQTVQIPELANFEGDFNADEPFTVWSVFNAIELRLDDLLESKPDSHLTEDDIRDAIKPNEILQSMMMSGVPLDDVPPAVVLKARIKAYKENESQLDDLAKDLRSKSSDLEAKFKKVLALCVEIDESKVDELVASLVQAVESDPEEVDIARVAGFLRKMEGS